MGREAADLLRRVDTSTLGKPAFILMSLMTVAACRIALASSMRWFCAKCRPLLISATFRSRHVMSARSAAATNKRAIAQRALGGPTLRAIQTRRLAKSSFVGRGKMAAALEAARDHNLNRSHSRLVKQRLRLIEADIEIGFIHPLLQLRTE